MARLREERDTLNVTRTAVLVGLSMRPPIKNILNVLLTMPVADEGASGLTIWGFPRADSAALENGVGRSANESEWRVVTVEWWRGGGGTEFVVRGNDMFRQRRWFRGNH